MVIFMKNIPIYLQIHWEYSAANVWATGTRDLSGRKKQAVFLARYGRWYLWYSWYLWCHNWMKERNTCCYAVGSATYAICGGLPLVSSQMPTQLLTLPSPNRTGVENKMKNLMDQNKDREIA